MTIGQSYRRAFAEEALIIAREATKVSADGCVRQGSCEALDQQR